ncbi:MAG: tyrosine-type recombinase/integrase [Myxococcota bacterium]
MIHGSKSDAEKELTRILGSRDVGLYVAPSKLTVDAYLDRWLVDGAKGTDRTRESARWLLEHYVRPVIGETRLDRLAPLDVQAVVSAMTKRELSARTIRLAIAILKQALRKAIAWRILASNPADGVELPKKEQREMRVLRTHEVAALRRALLEIVQETRGRAVASTEKASRDRWESDSARWAQARVLFDVMLALGVRPGEVAALRWSDLDLDAGAVTIRQARTWRIETDESGKRRRVQISAAPKTRSSVRSLPLGAALVATLRGHKAAQAERAMRLGAAYARDLDLVFANEIGRALDDRNVAQRWLREGLKRAGLDPKLRLYDLRHTSATHLLALGVNIKAVSERLGHTSAKMTLDVYSHVLPGMQEEATARIEAALLD